MSKLKAAECMKMDLYGLLRVKVYSKDKEVRRAYRRQALKLHPDKNPDNPNAAKNFQTLQRAFELLTDPIQKGEYDHLLRARDLAEERRRHQDAETRAFRQKSERREEEIRRQKDQEDEFKRMQRMRRQAEREEEERLMEEEKRENERRREKAREREREKREFNVKVKWSKGSSVDAESLKEVFSKYGAVRELVLRERRRVALVQYDNQLSAIKCLEENRIGGKKIEVELMFNVDYQQADDDEDDFEVFEKHFLENLHRKNQQQQPQHSQQQPQHSQQQPQHSQQHRQHSQSPQHSPKRPTHSPQHQQHRQQSPTRQQHQQQSPTRVNRDFESLQDRTSRQAAERKRIIEEMIENED